MIALCIFCSKSNKIRDSEQLAGILGSLRIELVSTAMKQEASALGQSAAAS